MEPLRLVAQLAVGIVFLLAVAGKLRDPRGFARGVADYRILPPASARPFAFALIPVEAFLALSHLTGWRLAVGAPLGLATLACFAAAVAVNLWRDRDLPCHCFGGGGETISGRTLGRLLLLAGAEGLILTGPALFAGAAGRLVYPHALAGPGDLGRALLWAAFSLVAGQWLLAAKDLAELARSRSCPGCSRPPRTGTDDSGGLT